MCARCIGCDYVGKAVGRDQREPKFIVFSMADGGDGIRLVRARAARHMKQQHVLKCVKRLIHLQIVYAIFSVGSTREAARPRFGQYGGGGVRPAMARNPYRMGLT
jgi:hypothetical protein